MRCKVLIRLLLVMVFSAPMSQMTANAESLFVDVNGDGEVNIADINAVIDYILNGETTTPIDLEKNYLSAKEFGAVGDGETDDTSALETLFEAAFMLKKAVLFDPGTYLIRRSLPLRSGMEIYGEDAYLRKQVAMVASLAEPAEKGQTEIVLTTVSGLKVGDQFVIVDNAGANQCTNGIVTGIDGYRVSFTNVISDHQSNFPGCIKDYDAGAKVSNSFALLRSWSSRFECDGVYIHDLTLYGSRRNSEPKVWSNSCIHMDSYYPGGYTGNTGIEYRNIQRDMVVSNVVILNSPCDAISDQGEGGLIVRDCVIENCAMHGVHMGTKYSNAVIVNNTMTGNGTAGSGVFFCQEVNNVLVDNNTITSFNHGCSDEEFGTAARNVTIRNNVFSNMNGTVFDFMMASSNFHGNGLQINDNQILNLKSTLFGGKYLDNVIISDNAVRNVVQQPSHVIKVTQSRNVVISGNTVLPSVFSEDAVDSTETVNLIQDANSWND